jgi:hypothetical protein
MHTKHPPFWMNHIHSFDSHGFGCVTSSLLNRLIKSGGCNNNRL